jgi:hypothetical protein
MTDLISYLAFDGRLIWYTEGARANVKMIKGRY